MQAKPFNEDEARRNKGYSASLSSGQASIENSKGLQYRDRHHEGNKPNPSKEYFCSPERGTLGKLLLEITLLVDDNSRELSSSTK